MSLDPRNDLDPNSATHAALFYQGRLFAFGNLALIVVAHHSGRGDRPVSFWTANLHEPDAALPYRRRTDDMGRHFLGQLPPLGQRPGKSARPDL